MPLTGRCLFVNADELTALLALLEGCNDERLSDLKRRARSAVTYHEGERP